MGKWLAAGNAKKPGSLIKTAYEHGVPIFCPAFATARPASAWSSTRSTR